MIFAFYPIAARITSGLRSTVEFTAAHEKITLGAGTDVLALQVDHFGVADGAEVPPVFFYL